MEHTVWRRGNDFVFILFEGQNGKVCGYKVHVDSLWTSTIWQHDIVDSSLIKKEYVKLNGELAKRAWGLYGEHWTRIADEGLSFAEILKNINE